MSSPDSPVHRYHDGTKHHFQRFARSLGYLDWASQPRPFRSFHHAPRFPLYPAPDAAPEPYAPRPASYDELFGSSLAPVPLTAAAIGDLFRHSLGLSAWKAFSSSRWSLRVNPSSGNLHPTEAYIVCGSFAAFGAQAGVFHYAAEVHALERRAAIDAAAWDGWRRDDVVLIALSSIHWREAWKYGERAFRYCQHDLGHAIAAFGLAAAMLGWQCRMLPRWSHRQIAALIGLDRDGDFAEAEREDPGCLLAIGPRLSAAVLDRDPEDLLIATASAEWTGNASQLSVEHIQWTFIDEIAAATEDPGRAHSDTTALPPGAPSSPRGELDARRLMLQRRSAVALDGISRLSARDFFQILERVLPAATPPWNALWWTPRLHLLLFVHRVDDVAPGLYAFGRTAEGLTRLDAALGATMLREPAHERLPLVRLARGDCRAMSRNLSCDQEIAADGFFSLGMIAEFDAAIDEAGPSFYRHLFWESGVIGQMLYLEAEASGGRGTGIGCFYDDPVHAAFGLQGHQFQSLYHFTIGRPIEDRRLTTAPGYAWETVDGREAIR